jgi:hypothetical protein
MSTSCSPGGLLGRASAFWRENRKYPPGRFGFEIPTSWSRTLPAFPIFGPSAREFRSADELARPAKGVCREVSRSISAYHGIFDTSILHTLPCIEYIVMLVCIRYSYKKTGTPAQFVRTGAKTCHMSHVVTVTKNTEQLSDPDSDEYKCPIQSNT